MATGTQNFEMRMRLFLKPILRGTDTTLSRPIFKTELSLTRLVYFQFLQRRGCQTNRSPGAARLAVEPDEYVTSDDKRSTAKQLHGRMQPVALQTQCLQGQTHTVGYHSLIIHIYIFIIQCSKYINVNK